MYNFSRTPPARNKNSAAVMARAVLLISYFSEFRRFELRVMHLLYGKRYRTVFVIEYRNDIHTFALRFIGVLRVGVEDQIIPAVKAAEGVIMSGVMPDLVVSQNGILC